MTIQEAIQTGKLLKRELWNYFLVVNGEGFLCYVGALNTRAVLSAEDICAKDYEVSE